MTVTRDARGVYAIAPTPFTAEGSVDIASLDRLVEFYREAAVDGLTILGQLGEAPKLSQDEAVAVASRVIARTDVPVIVGVSAPGFAAMTELSRAVMDAGAAGVMIAPPNTLRTDDQIVGYYRQASTAIGPEVPFVIQDYPLTFSVVMTPTVIQRIANECESCVMLKHEDWPGLEKISTLRQLEAQGAMPRLSILCVPRIGRSFSVLLATEFITVRRCKRPGRRRGRPLPGEWMLAAATRAQSWVRAGSSSVIGRKTN